MQQSVIGVLPSILISPFILYICNKDGGSRNYRAQSRPWAATASVPSECGISSGRRHTI